MKLPSIPLLEPMFMITLTRGTARTRHAAVPALQYLLWIVPASITVYVLAGADHGRHSFWLTTAAAYLVFAISVLLVGVRDGGGEEQK